MNRVNPLRVLLLIALFCSLSMAASAYVDLVSPEDGASSNLDNQIFEYYPSLTGVQSCTLTVDGSTVTDQTINNSAFNTFTLVNINEGAHSWSISCTNGSETEYSVSRSLEIDRSEPVLTILSPEEDEVIEEGRLTLIAFDDTSDELSCNVTETGNVLTSFTLPTATPTTKNLSLSNGNHTFQVLCADEAGNIVTKERTVTIEPLLFLELETNKATYALGEPITLSIDSVDNTDVSIEVCPDEQGFVECFTPLVSDTFPQTITLPYTNKTGTYLVEGVAVAGNRSVTDQTQYVVENTMAVTITPSRTPMLDKEFTLSPAVVGAIGDVTYRWKLSNGTVLASEDVTLTYTTPGSYVEQLTVTDEFDNNASANFSTRLLPEYLVTIKVRDDAGKAVTDAAVQLDDEKNDNSETESSDVDGKVLFTLPPESYKLFVSKSGFSYYYDKIEIDGDKTLTVTLTVNDNQKPKVTILSPVEGAKVSLPVSVGFKVEDASTTTCSLSYAKSGDDWMQQSGTLEVKNAKEQQFTIQTLEETTYSYMIECEDASGNLGESGTKSFTVVQGSAEAAEPTLEDLGFGEDPLEIIDKAYGAYDSFNAKQRELADLLGWEKIIKTKKKSIEQAERDRNAIGFRRDMTDEEKEAKRSNYTMLIKAASESTPLDLQVVESRTRVEYLKEEDLSALAAAIIKQKGYAFTEKEAVAYLKMIQQGFTKETKLFRAKIIKADGTTQPISVISHTFNYDLGKVERGAPLPEEETRDFVGSMQGSFTIYEAVPEEMAMTKKEISSSVDFEVLGERPLALEFAPEQEITYSVEKDVQLDILGKGKTLLLKKPSASDLSTITGNATFSILKVDWKLSLLISLILIIVILLIRRFDALRHLKYLFYAESKKGPLHSLKLLINDGLTHLEAGDTEKALMRYKEAKLSYERLTSYAQNEAYEPLLSLKSALDEHYSSILIDRIQTEMTSGRLADAIDDYARLEQTFAMLSPEQQQDLIALVTELGRKLGLGSNEAAMSGAEQSQGGEAR